MFLCHLSHKSRKWLKYDDGHNLAKQGANA